MKGLKITDVYHKDHFNWAKLLDFYKDEIQIFLMKLKEVQRSDPTNYSILEHTLEYEKILRNKLKNLAGMRKKIRTHEKQLKDNLPSSAESIWTHKEVEANLEAFILKFEALKKNYRRFVSRQIDQEK